MINPLLPMTVLLRTIYTAFYTAGNLQCCKRKPGKRFVPGNSWLIGVLYFVDYSYMLYRFEGSIKIKIRGNKNKLLLNIPVNKHFFTSKHQKQLI